MKLRYALFAALLVLTTVAALAENDDGGVLTPERLVDLRLVSDVVLHPDGDRAAYLLEVPRSPDDPPGHSYSELWVADLDKGKTRRFTRAKERVSAPAFSPDGKHVSFVVKREEFDPHAQIYTLRLGGGEARPLTRHPSSVEQYRWSPDGSSIAFTAEDPETEDEKRAEESGRDWKDWDQNPKYERLWLFDVDKRKSRRLFDDDLQVLDLEWAPDGHRLVVRAARSPRVDHDYMFSQLYTVAVDGADAAPRPLAATPGKIGAMAVSPDGERLAFLAATSANDPVAQSLFVVALDGDEPQAPRNLTPGFAASCSDLAWWDDETIFLVAVEGTRNAIFKVHADDGRRQRLDWPPLVVGDFDLEVANDRLAVAAHSAEHPEELYVGRADGGGLERFHDHNPELDSVRLARQEVVEWEGAGGWTIEGVLTYPLDYRQGRRYPLVLQVHGGPEGVSMDGWTSSATYPVQLLARDGFMVLQPNYRGSRGRGVDFSTADHDDLGGAEYEDVLAGVDALVERGLVDAARVGTGGWSYGGYFSAWAATRYSERFRAAVVGAGLTNWISFAGTTDIPNEMSMVHWDSWWYDEPELHWRRSPLAHLAEAHTPTLVLHGAEDERVHPEQGLELYTALRLKGVPARFVVYPREPHGLRERAHRLDAIARVLEWFGEHLKIPQVEAVEEPRD